MRTLGWLKSLFSVRHNALRAYRQGRKQARKKEHQRAVAYFTDAIEALAVPIDVKAMALYHRALAYVAAGNNEKGINDLESVLVLDGAMELVNIKTVARQLRTRIESQD